MSKNSESTTLEYLKNQLEVLKLWSEISACQKDILNNYQDMFWGTEQMKTLANIHPKFLQQSINPWRFSFFTENFVMKGNPEMEEKIVTEIAGYGSQLGTIIDFLRVIETAYPLDRKKLAGSGDHSLLKVCKFEELADKIDKVKA